MTITDEQVGKLQTALNRAFCLCDDGNTYSYETHRRSIARELQEAINILDAEEAKENEEQG